MLIPLVKLVALNRYKADVRYDGEAKPDTNVYYTPSTQGYNTLSNSILQEEPEDYQEEPEVTYRTSPKTFDLL